MGRLNCTGRLKSTTPPADHLPPFVVGLFTGQSELPDAIWSPAVHLAHAAFFMRAYQRAPDLEDHP
ncbi:MAG: hypothetical protein NVSMB55_21810 [Mycobacteriales bacterium]